MNEPIEPPTPAEAPFPKPVIVRANRLRFSLVWIVPLVALLVGAALVVRSLLQTGPLVTVTFRNAEGLEAGRTEVRSKEVVVGRVTKVGLSPDRGRVVATIRLDKSAAQLAVEDSKFWAVRPRVGTAGISGLSTLFSGVYIDTDAGESKEDRTHFDGLEAPPFVLRGEPGRRFVLDASDLGSLEVGSPVYYRRIRVGRVVGYGLDAKRDKLEVQVLIDPPNHLLVTPDTRFWNAGGIDVSLNASGLNVNTESIASLVVGGIAFANPVGAVSAPTAAPGTRFALFADKRAALAVADGTALPVRMQFTPAVRGLSVGAVVEMLGTELGTVRQVAMRFDGASQRFATEVHADLYPARLGDARREFMGLQGGATATDAQFLKHLVERGLRAQVKGGNPLTGQQAVALELLPKAPKATLNLAQTPLQLPTLSGAAGDLSGQASDIMARIGRIPFEQIGANLAKTLNNTGVATATLQDTLKGLGSATTALQQTLGSADTAIQQISPKAQTALAETQAALKALQATLDGVDRHIANPEAALQRDASQALGELQRAARALRVLSDYLQQHPETLLRGKPADAEVTK
jgi:paraquat-inducible protein B